MLIHRCADPGLAGSCGAVSINRVAADDLPARLWDVYEDSLARSPQAALAGIDVLGREAWHLLRSRLV